jgi:predicted alpha/beta-hydrolase family hydrolase
MASKPLTFPVGDGSVSALLDAPKDARAGYMLAHGAGAGMAHPFLAKVAAGLAERGIACFRYQFPYMEKKSGRPDSPKVAQAAVRAAVGEAGNRLKGVPLFAGGKSFGGRMTSQAESEEPLGVAGLAFFGFPLHAPGRPSDERAAHLADVKVPLLFLQGTRDDFADLSLLKPLVKRLGKRATLHLFDDADHSFHVRKASGRTDADVMEELLDTVTGWMDAVLARKG